MTEKRILTAEDVAAIRAALRGEAVMAEKIERLGGKIKFTSPAKHVWPLIPPAGTWAHDQMFRKAAAS